MDVAWILTVVLLASGALTFTVTVVQQWLKARGVFRKAQSGANSVAKIGKIDLLNYVFLMALTKAFEVVFTVTVAALLLLLMAAIALIAASVNGLF